jgi:hypothetical protein
MHSSPAEVFRVLKRDGRVISSQFWNSLPEL